MGIITRTPYAPGNTVTSSGQNTSEQRIYDEFNGNIDDANISPTAAIQGTKIASKPNGIPQTRINAKAVGDVELANDATVDANRAVGSDHIKNSVIIKRTIKLLVTDIVCGVGAAGVPAQGSNGIDITISNPGPGILVATPLDPYFVNQLPFEIRQQRAGVPTGDDAFLIPRLQIDTVTGKIYLVIHNISSSPVISLNGITYEILSITI